MFNELNVDLGPTPESTNGALTTKSVPRCATPWTYRSTSYYVAGLGAILIGIWIVSWLGWTLLMYFGEIMFFAAGLGTQWYFYDRHIKRLKSRVVHGEGAVCLRCGYSLKGLPPEHTCPECGQKYKLKDTRQVWELWIKKRFPADWLSIESAREIRKQMLKRKTCIRCGQDISQISTRLCPACGAKHGYEEPVE